MELIALLQTLWRRRWLVLLGVPIAATVGYLALQGSTQQIGVASMRVMLDTPASQTVDVAPPGADTLAWRADFMAILTGSTEVREDVARRMKISPNQLIIVTPALGTPEYPLPLPGTALDAAYGAGRRYTVGVQAAPFLPIMRLDAQAPDPKQAAALLTAVSDALRSSVASHSATDGLQPLVVEEVGPPRARAVIDGPRRIMAPVAAAVVMTAWCAMIMLIDGVRRRRRFAEELLLIPDEPSEEPERASVTPVVETVAVAPSADGSVRQPVRRHWDDAPESLPPIGIDSNVRRRNAVRLRAR